MPCLCFVRGFDYVLIVCLCFIVFVVVFVVFVLHLCFFVCSWFGGLCLLCVLCSSSLFVSVTGEAARASSRASRRRGAAAPSA